MELGQTLRLINDDEGTVERAAAHKIQGLKLDIRAFFDVFDAAIGAFISPVQDLQIVIKCREPRRHFFLLRAGQKPDLLGNRRRGARYDQLFILLLFENGMQAIRQCQKRLPRARWPSEHSHIDLFTIEQSHGHGLLEVARRKPPEPLIHQMVTAIDGEVDKIRVDMINIGNEFLLVINKLIRICVRQLGPRDAM